MAVIAIAVVACVNMLITVTQSGRSQAMASTTRSACTVTQVTPYMELSTVIGVRWKSSGQCNKGFYTIAYNEVGDSQRRYRNGKTSDNYAVLDGLKACTEYKIIVVHKKKRKDHSKEEQFAVSSFARHTAYHNPPPPSNVAVTFDNVTTVQITWDKPEEWLTNCLTDYLLELYSIPVDCGTWEEFKCLTEVYNQTLVDNNATLTTDSLDECEWYAVSVTPNRGLSETVTVAKQIGARFSVANSTGFDLTVRNLLLVEKGTSWLTVKWKPVEQYSNCVISYQVTVSCTPEPCVGAISEIVNGTSYNATDLDQCSMYHIEVVSLDYLGENIGYPTSVTGVTNSRDAILVHNITAKTLSPHVVTLSWTLPPDKQLCVDSYSVFWNEIGDSGTTTSKNTAVSGTFHTVTNLVACRRYSFHVYLHKEERVLGLGGTIDAITLPETPGKVQNLTGESGSHSIKLHWDPPVISESCVNRYLVSYTNMNNTRDFLVTSMFERNSKIVIVPSTNTTVELIDLPACIAYNVSVYAIGVDKSESEPEVFAVTVTAEVLPEPSGGTVLHVTQTSATLQWNIPFTSMNLCPMIKMNVQCALLESGGNVNAHFKNRDSSGNVKGTINGLTPYTRYKCKAKAFSSAGYSVSTEYTDLLTIQGIPSEPTNVSISIRTSTRILVMWSPPTQIPGHLMVYMIHVRKQYLTYFVPTSCTSKVFKDYNISVSANTTSYWLSGLQPSMGMTIAINAATSTGYGPLSGEVVAFTLPGESDPIRNVSVRVSHNDTTITWKHPCFTHGMVYNFLVELSGMRDGHPIINKMTWTNKAALAQLGQDPVYEETIYDLKPEYLYLVQISPIGIVAGSTTSITFMCLASIPPEPSLPVMSSVEPVPTYTQADLTLYSNLFSDSSGRIVYYAILLAEDSFPVPPQSGWIDSNTFWPLVDTWSTAYKHSPVSMYQSTPIRWDPFNASLPYQTVDVTYTLGKEDCSSSSSDPNDYCNGPLTPGITYALRIRAFTTAGYRDSRTIKFKTEAITSFLTLTIVSLVVTIIATIGIFMFLLSTGRITRMTQEVAEKNQTVEMSLESQLLTPIPVKKFLTHCNMILASQDKLKEEFQLLTTLSADIKLTSEISLLPHNRKKNRYINILPYDTNRVILEGEPEEDYINASYIRFPGEKPNIEYIACQAPKEEYCKDFWQMMIQCNVTIIVMLCLKMEKGKVKCFIYYPQLSESMEFDGITVVCTEKMMYQFHTVRTLVVTKDNQQYTVLHYHFVDWPDFGVPSSSDVMLHFCQAVRAASKGKDCVMAVHCSAGVGRTGTFIALDNLIRNIRNNKKMNVFATVLKLREQRANMVQTEMQYGYIYKCLKHALEHQADFLRGDAKAAERLARQDLYPLTRRDSTFPEIETVT